MLHDVVVHIHNEQPLRADLVFEPAATDAVLICRNLRTMSGNKPTFADHADSMFMIPLAQVRFIEIPRSAMDAHAAEMGARSRRGAARQDDRGPLERPAGLTAGRLDAGVPAPAGPVEDGAPDRLDADLLRRIRDV